MKTLLFVFCLALTPSAWAHETEEEESVVPAEKPKKMGSETVTREKIRAMKEKNKKTVEALEDIDEGTEEEEE